MVLSFPGARQHLLSRHGESRRKAKTIMGQKRTWAAPFLGTLEQWRSLVPTWFRHHVLSLKQKEWLAREKWLQWQFNEIEFIEEQIWLNELQEEWTETLQLPKPDWACKHDKPETVEPYAGRRIYAEAKPDRWRATGHKRIMWEGVAVWASLRLMLPWTVTWFWIYEHGEIPTFDFWSFIAETSCPRRVCTPGSALMHLQNNSKLLTSHTSPVDFPYSLSSGSLNLGFTWGSPHA